mmetsp:Transcript_22365/g.69070  ORF Transcript_22365/g.69070 Transcript_22365/m.69070 type:complete len:220 (+) Transcript_22365:166-825(+)
MGNESSTSSTSTYREPRTRESIHGGGSSRQSTPQSNSTVPPGAYSVPGSQRRQAQFYVTVPAGIRPGQEFPVIANGQQLMVRCPPGIRPGERIVVSAPRSSQGTQAYMATVPHGVRSGEQFPVLVNNQQLMVTCPPGVRPGMQVRIMVPTSRRGLHLPWALASIEQVPRARQVPLRMAETPRLGPHLMYSPMTQHEALSETRCSRLMCPRVFDQAKRLH